MTKNNRTQTTSLRTSAWVVSLITQLVALILIGIVAFSFGVVGIGITVLLAIGYIFLMIRTVQHIKGKLINKDSISTLTAIHLVTFVVSILAITVFSAFYYGTSF